MTACSVRKVAAHCPSGARTNATTVGASARFAGGWEVAASATTGSTMMGSSNTALSVSPGGLRSTAYEFVTTKTGLFGMVDQLRISVAQPLHIESGNLFYRSIEVVDRNSGALGPVAQNWNVSGNREHRVEAIYAVPVLDGRAQVSGFDLVDLNPPEANGRAASVSVGAQINLNF